MSGVGSEVKAAFLVVGVDGEVRLLALGLGQVGAALRSGHSGSLRDGTDVVPYPRTREVADVAGGPDCIPDAQQRGQRLSLLAGPKAVNMWPSTPSRREARRARSSSGPWRRGAGSDAGPAGRSSVIPQSFSTSTQPALHNWI